MANGVYEIHANGVPIYVGESRNIERRWESHRHYSQAACLKEDKYVPLWNYMAELINAGVVLSVHIIISSDEFLKKDRLKLEKARILELEKIGIELKYNKQHRGHSLETRAKIAASRTGVSNGTWKWTPEARARHSELMKGNQNARADD